MECLDLRIYCVWLDELVTIRFCFHSTEIIFSRNIYLLKMRFWSTIYWYTSFESHYLFVMMLCVRVWLYKLTAGDRMDVSINRKIKINDYRNVLCLCCGNDVEKYEFTYLEAQNWVGLWSLSSKVIYLQLKLWLDFNHHIDTKCIRCDGIDNGLMTNLYWNFGTLE